VTTPGAPSDAQLRECWHALENSGGSLRRRVQRELQTTCGVPSTWIDVLLLLASAPDQRQPMHVAATQSGLTSGGLTKLADRMQLAGLLTRTHSPEDRRIVYLELTAEGTKQAATIAAHQITVLRRQLAALTSADIRTLTDTLHAVHAQLSPVALRPARRNRPIRVR
jgi:DNA-binding MarR family transcriptional regulator